MYFILSQKIFRIKFLIIWISFSYFYNLITVSTLKEKIIVPQIGKSSINIFIVFVKISDKKISFLIFKSSNIWNYKFSICNRDL